MNALRQDVSYAIRALVGRPGYAAATLLVLMLAIGANTTVFSIFNGFFLRPLPYPHGDRLVSVYNSYPKVARGVRGTSVPDYLDRREQAKSLEDLALYAPAERTLTGDGAPVRLNLMRATPSLFNVLGIRPMLGRVFAKDEASPGRGHVAVLSYRLWRTRFGGRAGVVGSKMRLDGQLFRVIGVMPRGFGFPDTDVDGWIPFVVTPQQTSDSQRGALIGNSIGRLRPGATLAILDAELDAIVRRNAKAGRMPFPGFVERTGFTGRARLWRSVAVGDLEKSLLLLQGIVLVVLLMACANVANLQLARMAGRRKELSMRAALGASRGRLARLVLVESLLLALLGALGGMGVARGGLELVRLLGLDRAEQGFQFPLDATVLGFTAGAALLAALLSAALPLLSLMRDDLTRAVHESGRSIGGGRSAAGVRSALVVVQVAASVALLVAAGLLTKNFYLLQKEGPGFVTRHVLTARVALPELRYADGASRARFYEQALEKLRALPGVSGVGFTSDLPFSGSDSGSTIAVEGYTQAHGGAPPAAHVRSISEGYFRSLGIPIVRGRNFKAGETESVAIVDENMVRQYWPNADPLGQRVRKAGPGQDGEGGWAKVIGVVPTIKHDSLEEEAGTPTIYWYYRQHPQPEGAFTLRTALAPELLMRAASDAIHAIDPELALYGAMPMRARVERSLGPQRTSLVLTLVFGACAFALAVIGVHAVLTWAVTQRLAEIALRMALGAQAADVARMVLWQGAKLTAAGLALGVFGAFALGRLLQSQVPRAGAADPAVFAVALSALAAAAFLATWLPARRASRIDPMEALRAE